MLAFIRRPRRISSSTCVFWKANASSKPFPVLASQLTFDPSQIENGQKFNAMHEKRVEYCRNGGGSKGVERHVKKNRKVLVWDRIEQILDEAAMDDFLEVGATVGIDLEYGDVPGGGTVTGIGRINNTHVMLIANDATVKGGTSYPITVTKSLRAQEIAHNLRIPTLYIVDTGGAFLPLQSEIFPDLKHGGRTFRNQAIMSGEGIPQIALVSGMCTAGGAYTPTMSDEAIMVNKIANIYLGGPPLVKAATGEVVTGEQLGGARLHCETSGIADHFAETEAESFEIVRDIIATLNINENWPSNAKPVDPPEGQAGDLIALSGFDKLNKDAIYSVVRCLLDGSRFTEFKKRFGPNLVTGFGFLDGRLIGVLGNGGDITQQDAQKGAHFIQLCDQRSIPILFLQNSSNSGLETSYQDETILKERAKMIRAQAVARVPKIALAVAPVCHDELMTMCGPSGNPEFNFMWPGSGLKKHGFECSQICDSDPVDVSMGSAQYWSSRSTCDGIIRPQESRMVLAKAFYLSCLNFQARPGRNGEGNKVFRIGFDKLNKDAIYSVVRCLLDGSRFTEFKKRFGPNLVTGFGFLDGRLIGVLGNGGDITQQDAQKGAHFIQLCDQRSIPILFLQNSSNSGLETSYQDETILKERAKMIRAQAVARVPKIALAVAPVCHDELMTMCGPSGNPEFNFMWPGSGLKKHGFECSQICDSDPVDVSMGSAQYWSSRSTCDGIIRPQESRMVLAKAFYLSCLNFQARPGRNGEGNKVFRM
ncbi:hypothetical protein TCAL_12773 [Tigriopus californicus]|uniref:methylcrotonoyl-CoA carboxylase n=1 Tax=Tigriopus californicus TaxID=6832 RepID=A0A553PQF8_TIGCA|nr:hypothetical protein TCAL_12773 [Tigriopus californicus]